MSEIRKLLTDQECWGLVGHGGCQGFLLCNIVDREAIWVIVSRHRVNLAATYSGSPTYLQIMEDFP